MRLRNPHYSLCSCLDIGEGGFPPSKIYAHKRPPGPLHPYPHRRRVSSSSRIGLSFPWHAVHLPDARRRSIVPFQRMPTFLRDDLISSVSCVRGRAPIS
ncbi:hypothetical protein CSPAE12_06478 [Colletotrichum incanum]|nr:hypothetical protein CSPAE12_06478 [Colletotrichum incanum]